VTAASTCSHVIVIVDVVVGVVVVGDVSGDVSGDVLPRLRTAT
jgi:hypothetical protein